MNIFKTAYAIDPITNPVISEELGANPDGGVALGIIIGQLYRAAVMAGGLALLLYIAWGGINWITAGGDKNKLENAKNQLLNGVIGMAILVGSSAIAAFLSNLFGFDLLNPSL